MKTIGKIAGINILLLLLFMVFIIADSNGGDNSAFLFTYAFVIAALAAINGIAGVIQFIMGHNDLGKACLISAGLVLLIGFSTCYGWSTNM